LDLERKFKMTAKEFAANHDLDRDFDDALKVDRISQAFDQHWDESVIRDTERRKQASITLKERRAKEQNRFSSISDSLK